MKNFKQFITENKYYFTIDNAPNSNRIAANGIFKGKDKKVYIIDAPDPTSALHMMFRCNRLYLSTKKIKSTQITPHLYSPQPSQEERMKQTHYWKKDFE